MKLPVGSLADVRHDSDYLKVLKMHATIEPLLNQLLEKSISQALMHPKVNFPGGDAVAALILESGLDRKVKLAEQAELITVRQAKFIRALSQVRNHYAHSIHNMPLSIMGIAQKISPQDAGRNITGVLFGITKEGQKRKYGAIVTAMMSPFVFHNFASLVHAVVEGIDPPPFPAGKGILSDLFQNALSAEEASDQTTN
jgi:hypothetical protein